jgi:hypothetical protein
MRTDVNQHYQLHDLKVVFEDLELKVSSETDRFPRPIHPLGPHQILEAAIDCGRLFTCETIDIFQRNLNASFSLLARLARAESFSEILALQAGHLTNQRSAFIGQTEELINLSIRTTLDLLRGSSVARY